MYSVYKHTNIQNGKVYIGITKQKASCRWHGGYGYSKQPLFYNAILTYGWDGFSHEILFTGLNQDEAFQKEKELIQKYNSTNRDYGYNILSKRGKYIGRKNPNAKMVRCLETGRIYACMKEAELETGANNHNISSVCNGRLKTAGGYHWKYV